MSKITRKAQKIFGSTSGTNQVAQFGSLAAGSPAFSTDPDVIQGLSNFLAGWFSGVIGGNSPALEDLNALPYLFSYQLAYLMQTGVPEWNTTTVYYKGSLCSSAGVVYISLTDSNTGNAVTSAANWGAFQPYLNVRAFGAKGDGVNDDTTAIQAALTAVSANQSTVLIPAGTYILSAPLVPKNNTRIIGERNGTILTVATSGGVISTTRGSGYFQATDLQNFSMTGIKIDGKGSWTATPFPYPYGAGNTVGFTNDDCGVSISYSSVGVKNISILDCEFTGLSRAILMKGFHNQENVTIDNVYFHNLGRTSTDFNFLDTVAVTHCRTEGVYGGMPDAGGGDTNIADSKFGDVHLFTACQNVLCSDNFLTNYLRAGIIIEPSYVANTTGNTHTSTTVDNLSSAFVTIITNLLAQSPTKTLGINGTGIPVNAVVVSVASSTSIVISSATTSSLTGTPIYLQVYSQWIQFADNEISYQVSSRGSQGGYGIYCGDEYNKAPIRFVDNLIHDIYGSGTDYTSGGTGIATESADVNGGEIYACYKGIQWVANDVCIKGVNIHDNYFQGINWPSTATGDVKITNCDFVRNGFSGIDISTQGSVGTPMTQIMNNYFKDNGLLTTPLGSGHEGLGLCGINVSGAIAGQALLIKDNVFVSSASAGDTVGQLSGIAIHVNVGVYRYIASNEFIFNGTLAAYPSNLQVGPACLSTWFNTGGYTYYDLFGLMNRNNKTVLDNSLANIAASAVGYLRCLGYASAAPGAGTFRTGDYYLNSSVSSGGKFVFVCVSGGTPGTWQSLTLS